MAIPDEVVQRARDEAVKKVAGLSVYRLSGLADCGDPEDAESDGAKMLSRVRDGVVELLEGLDLDDVRLIAEDRNDVSWLDDDGEVYQIADDAPSVYTHERWTQFVDLAAYQEDTEDLPAGDLTETAAVVLVRIAERLAQALLVDAAANIAHVVESDA